MITFACNLKKGDVFTVRNLYENCTCIEESDTITGWVVFMTTIDGQQTKKILYKNTFVDIV